MLGDDVDEALETYNLHIDRVYGLVFFSIGVAVQADVYRQGWHALDRHFLVRYSRL